MTFDPKKPVLTRDGRKARIIATDINSGDGSIAAAITEESGEESLRLFHADGRYLITCDDDLDLINLPEKKTVYINITKSGSIYQYPSESEAMAYSLKYDEASAVPLTYEIKG